MGQAVSLKSPTSIPTNTKLTQYSQESANWVLGKLGQGAGNAWQQAESQGEKITDSAKGTAAHASHRASEAARKAEQDVKEEL